MSKRCVSWKWETRPASTISEAKADAVFMGLRSRAERSYFYRQRWVGAAFKTVVVVTNGGHFDRLPAHYKSHYMACCGVSICFTIQDTRRHGFKKICSKKCGKSTEHRWFNFSLNKHTHTNKEGEKTCLFFCLCCRFSFWAACDVEMKLDEKIVSHYESCNSPVDKEGYLYKKVRHIE